MSRISTLRLSYLLGIYFQDFSAYSEKTFPADNEKRGRQFPVSIFAQTSSDLIC
jgi:hypothetical protein